MKRSTIFTAMGLALAGGALPAHAWDIDWSLGLAYEHSDNIGRRAFDVVSGNTVSPFFEIDATQDGDVLRANIVGAFEYDYYSDDGLDANFGANAGVNLVWSIQPERWLWSLDNYIAQEPIDIFATQSPENVQNTNVFVTGPILMYRFSDAMSGRARLAYMNTYADETEEFNSNRLMLDARAIRDVSEVSSLSLNGAVESVSLDDPTPAAPNFDRYAAFGGYDWRSARTTTHVDLGWNWVNFDESESMDGPLARMTVEFEASPISAFDLELAHQLSDAATDLASAIPDASSLLVPQSIGGVGGTTTIGSEVYEVNRLSAGYTRMGDRFVIRGSGYFVNEDYDTNETLNQRNHGALATIDYRVSARTTVGVFANMNWEDFTEVEIDNRESEYGISFNYNVLRNLDFVLEATQAERTSNEPTNEFDETRYYAAIVWRRR